MEATEPLVKYSNTCFTYCLFAVTATAMLQANVTSILVMSQGKYLIHLFHLIHLFLTIIAAKVERKFYNFYMSIVFLLRTNLEDLQEEQLDPR